MIPDRCRPWLEAALREGDGGHTIEDIESGLANGEHRLVEGENLTIVIELVRKPRCKVLTVFLAGGDPHAAMPELIEKLPWLHQMADGVGARLQLQGRRGWLKTLAPHGWREDSVTMTRSAT